MYSNPNRTTGPLFMGEIQTIHRLRRFVFEREQYPDSERATQDLIVKDLNSVLRECGFQVMPKQRPRSTQDRRARRFRLCCSEHTRANPCCFHITLNYFPEYGWCMNLTKGQPRGKFEHSCDFFCLASLFGGLDADGDDEEFHQDPCDNPFAFSIETSEERQRINHFDPFVELLSSKTSDEFQVCIS